MYIPWMNLEGIYNQSLILGTSTSRKGKGMDRPPRHCYSIIKKGLYGDYNYHADSEDNQESDYEVTWNLDHGTDTRYDTQAQDGALYLTLFCRDKEIIPGSEESGGHTPLLETAFPVQPGGCNDDGEHGEGNEQQKTLKFNA